MTLGLIFYFMVTGKIPAGFSFDSVENVFQDPSIIENITYPADMPSDIKDLIMKCFDLSKDNSVTDLLQNPIYKAVPALERNKVRTPNSPHICQFKRFSDVPQPVPVVLNYRQFQRRSLN